MHKVEIVTPDKTITVDVIGIGERVVGYPNNLSVPFEGIVSEQIIHITHDGVHDISYVIDGDVGYSKQFNSYNVEKL